MAKQRNSIGGYKQTELGLIPDDWDIVQLRELGSFSKGAGIRKDQSMSGDIPCVRYGELYTNHHDIIRKFRSFISEEVATQSKKIKFGDILFAGSGETKEEIGKCVANLSEEAVYAGGDIVILSPSKVSSHFLGYALNAPSIAAQKSSKGQGDAVVHISASALCSITVALPKEFNEQEAIAEALSDADALIELLEQLIAKKHKIKTRLLEDLVTGNKRLTEYSEDWVEKRLGSCAVLKARIGWQGLTTAEYLESGDYYLITGTEFKNGRIDWAKCHFVEKARYDQDKNIQVKFDDVLVTKDGTIGKVAIIKDMPADATLNSGIFVIRPLNNSFEPDFLYYVLRSSVFEAFLDQLAAGSTINHLYQKDFVNFVFKAPPTATEQNEITNILKEADSEIAGLESKLYKAKQAKQGIMQVLLTGKVRLV